MRMIDALTISGLTKTYKDFILDGISFSVPSGSIVGLIGENGAGKSTTINAILGLIQKEAGSVLVLGKEELDNEIKEQVGVVFDGRNSLSQKAQSGFEKHLSLLGRTHLS